MGSGGYSSYTRSIRAEEEGYYTKSKEQIFSQKEVHEGMNPKGIKCRESRDSMEHPESLAIIIALDETGSMGYMPHNLIKDGLPTIMETIMGKGVHHPQVMFCGIGDAHNNEKGPLQISQFESSDLLLDNWLTKIFLEEKGGGNDGEDYSFIHYFAGHHTSIDCFEKRREKGFLFTIGDDKPHPSITSYMFKKYLGELESSDQTAEEMLKSAQKLYNVYHIHVGYDEASYGVESRWKQLLKENFIICSDYTQAPKKIAEIIAANAIKYNSSVLSASAENNDISSTGITISL